MRLHKNSYKPEYKAWDAMKQRCFNQKCKAYKNYGGRGISVCDNWLAFDNFIADMGYKPSPKHSLDRIDNHKGYEPENCKWATRHEQNSNRRNNIVINGITLNEFAKLHNINFSTLAYRYHTMGLRDNDLLRGSQSS